VGSICCKRENEEVINVAGKIYFEKPQYSFQPSIDYYRTQQRFREILEQKLNQYSGETNFINQITLNEISQKLNQHSSEIGSVGFSEILAGQLFWPDHIVRAYSGNEKLNLFDPDDVTKKSHVSKEFIDKKLEGTALEGLGESFKKAEAKYGVNALFLAALAAHESAMGTSRIARDKNNLFGFGAFDRSPYASAKKFASKEEGIMEVAAYLSKHYLKEGGKYFSGYSVEAIGKRYASDPNWANALKSQMSRLFIG